MRFFPVLSPSRRGRGNMRTPVDTDISLANQTILCLATQAWDAHWTPVQQVMLRLAPHNRVIYFEPFHPPLAWLKKSNSLLKAQRNLPQLREVHPNLLVYRPGYPYLPWNMKQPLAATLNGPIYQAEIRALLRRVGAQNPWLWVFFAQSLSVLNLPFQHVIYDCADEFAAFFPDPAEKRFVEQIDAVLCRRAELVFVGSEPLYATKAPFNPHTYVVNHAADIAHFMRATEPDTVIPEALQAVPRPRIGFVGMVDDVRFDTQLIVQLAENPHYHIVIVGGLLGDTARAFPQQPNIHLFGMQPVSALPAFIKGLDVCLMPYRLNEATRNIYPLKLHEYMATGKPVVTT
ncbi:MAG: glycosyltransferase family 1 protein, partial [Candidatus Tectomicrobia bacterium]|nr:glycosyltransferase family 1 protein [Candidatus Tectomicrobia bacterium]